MSDSGGGQMTPKVKIFEMSSLIHRRDSKLRFVAKFGENKWKTLNSSKRCVRTTAVRLTGRTKTAKIKKANITFAALCHNVNVLRSSDIPVLKIISVLV